MEVKDQFQREIILYNNLVYFQVSGVVVYIDDIVKYSGKQWTECHTGT